MTGNIKFSEDGKGAVDLYIDHVLITSLEVDTRRKFEVWVNCNALKPETSRNNIIQNDVFKEFMIHLRHYTSRFLLREMAVDEQKLMFSDVQQGAEFLLKSYLKDMKVNVKSTGLKLSGDRSVKLKKKAAVAETLG